MYLTKCLLFCHVACSCWCFPSFAPGLSFSYFHMSSLVWVVSPGLIFSANKVTFLLVILYSSSSHIFHHHYATKVGQTAIRGSRGCWSSCKVTIWQIHYKILFYERSKVTEFIYMITLMAKWHTYLIRALFIGVTPDISFSLMTNVLLQITNHSKTLARQVSLKSSWFCNSR